MEVFAQGGIKGQFQVPRHSRRSEKFDPSKRFDPFLFVFKHRLRAKKFFLLCDSQAEDLRGALKRRAAQVVAVLSRTL